MLSKSYSIFNPKKYYSSRMGKPTRHLAFSQNYYCAFMHPIFKIKLSRITWPCIAGSIVLVKNLILLKVNLQNLRFATF